MTERENTGKQSLRPKELAKLRQQIIKKRFSADELERLAHKQGFIEVECTKHRKFEHKDDPQRQFQIPYRPGRSKDVSTGLQHEALRVIFPELFK